MSVTATLVTLAIVGGAQATAQSSRDLTAHFISTGDDVRLIYASCPIEHECPVAVFTCTPAERAIWLTALTNEAIASWLFGDQHADGTQPTATLSIDSVVINLTVTEMSYAGGGDMFDNWWVKLMPMSGWLEAFTSAEFVAIEAPGILLRLTHGGSDRGARGVFAEACLAM